MELEDINAIMDGPGNKTDHQIITNLEANVNCQG